MIKNRKISFSDAIEKYCKVKLVTMSMHIVRDKIRKELVEFASFSDMFGTNQISRITINHIKELKSFFITENVPPFRINDKLRLYLDFFEYFKTRGFIDANPVNGISKTIPRPVSKAATHTLIEVLETIHHIKNPYIKQVIEFIYSTKLRPKEVFNLTIGDIDFKNEIIRFKRNWDRRQYECDSIQMPEEVKEFCLKCAQGRDRDEILFPSIQHKRSGKPIVSVRTALDNASYKAGVYPSVTLSSIISPKAQSQHIQV